MKMYVYNLDWNNFKKCLQENDIVILGISSSSDILNGLFKGSLVKLNRIANPKWVIGIMEKDEFYLNSKMKKAGNLTPIIYIYKNQKLLKEVYGFKDYKRIYDEIELEKAA